MSHSPCGSVDWNVKDLARTRKTLQVTPLAGVWIEMHEMGAWASRSPRHSPCGSVDWNLQEDVLEDVIFGHSPCGSVDWNKGRNSKVLDLDSHSPCGSVDWNLDELEPNRGNIVTPLAGVWIEIRSVALCCAANSSLPLRECGLKFTTSFYDTPTVLRHSPCGSVDWNCEISGGLYKWLIVTPLAGVWIEITSHYTIIGGDWSLPLRECGLKLVSAHMGARTGGHSPCGSVDWNEPEVQKVLQKWVTPLAGVWIEITDTSAGSWQNIVTPLAGVWIEIE